MDKKIEDMIKLQALNDGQTCNVGPGIMDERQFVVCRNFNYYFLFEVPAYGGEPYYLNEYYDDIDSLIDDVWSGKWP